MKTDRPVNISPTSYLPIVALASITHRATGMALFVGTAYLIYLLDVASSSAAGFAQATVLLHGPGGKIAAWAVLATLGYHFIAGIKHLLLDFHVGDSLQGARLGSQITLTLAALSAVLAGVWLW